MLKKPNGECSRFTKMYPASEKIVGEVDATIGHFWAWAYSDLFCNTVRPIFAEFIVGKALGVLDRPRLEWNAYYFAYRGKKIEVKSSGYLQSDPQDCLSSIRFDIENRKMAWDAETNQYNNKAGRSADCYVFCIHAEKDEAVANILNLNQWRFFVMATSDICRCFGLQKSVALSRIEKMVVSISYGELRKEVDSILGLRDTAEVE
jgi:hypothetical protein